MIQTMPPVLKSIGGKYFQLRLDEFANNDAEVYYAEGNSVIASTTRDIQFLALTPDDQKNDSL